MTVHVDDYRAPARVGRITARWSHLTAGPDDDLAELHALPLDGIDLDGIGWMIAGGESGPGYRPPEAAWFRALRDQCTANGIPFFFKQWGGPTPKAGGRMLDGRTWSQIPATTLGGTP